MTRRGLLAGAALLAGGCGDRPTTTPDGKRLLTIWHPWGGVTAPRFQRVAEQFEAEHPEIKLRLVFTQNNIGVNQKFITSVAAGTPPDLTLVDGPQVASWAEWGSLESLDDRIAAAGIKAEDYFPPTWRQNVYRDRVWAMTYCADPNFGFAWNKQAFRKAGLDPERPPTNIQELTEFSDRLTRKEKGGGLSQMGIIPWLQYGKPNSMFTWGWAFGGEFYDPATQRITADHPQVVKALEWMASFAKRFDPSRIAGLAQGFGTGEQNPFYSGKLGMQCLHIGGVGEAERYAPDLDYGITYLPAPPDGEARSSWVGGWCVAIPRGSRNPDDAWTFMRWACAELKSTATVGREQIILPGLRTSPYFEEIRNKRHYGDYVRILKEARHQRPVMPVQAFYMRELERAVDAAVYGRATAAEALARARKNTQAELEMALAGS